MAHNSYQASGLEPERAVWLAVRSLQPTSWLPSALSVLRLLFAVLGDALAAQRNYERLRRKGLPDAKAIRQAFFGYER